MANFYMPVGDVDGDGKITAFDAFLIFQYVAGNINLNATQMVCADVNYDEQVTGVDARLINQHLAGINLITKLVV